VESLHNSKALVVERIFPHKAIEIASDLVFSLLFVK
jgi:hypothetical protein